MAIKAIQGTVVGTDALKRHLKTIEERLGEGAHVRMGFLADATYPANEAGKSLPVAQVAFWNEYGTNPAKGPKVPSRPAFRAMIERKSPRWGVALGNFLRKEKYDAERSLMLMGVLMKEQLQQSINHWSSPPNAKSTIARKGFNAPLRHTQLMVRSVDFQVLHGQDSSDEQQA